MRAIDQDLEPLFWRDDALIDGRVQNLYTDTNGVYIPSAHFPAQATNSAPNPAPLIVTDFTALRLELETNFARWNWSGDAALIGTTFITYSFRTEANLPATEEWSYSINSVFGFSQEQQNDARIALGKYESTSGIVFIEVLEHGMIDFVGMKGSNVAGYTPYADQTRRAIQPFEFLGLRAEEDSDFSPGTTKFYTLLHEIGHRLGLKHPFEGTITLDPSLDNYQHTVMSYSSGIVHSIGLLDRDAIRDLYGLRTSLDDQGILYDWDEIQQIFTATGGIGDDAITGVLEANIIAGDLGHDTLLGGYKDDHLDGGEGNDNLFGGIGNDTLLGDIGSDLIFGGAGNDIIFGDTEVDISLLLDQLLGL